MTKHVDEGPLCAKRCPSRQVMEMLADKWKLLVFHSLRQKGVMRNGELMRALEGVSQKMLTQTLRALERDGLIERHDFKEVPPRVEYTLSPLGLSLIEVIGPISDWGQANMASVEAARAAYDKEMLTEA